MKSIYTLEKRRLFILASSGEYNKTDFLSYPQIISDECEKEKIYKILINALGVKETNVSTIERFFIGEKIATLIGPQIKIAVAWPEQDINKFAETVAVNRGSRIHVVGDIATAKRWLLDKSEV